MTEASSPRRVSLESFATIVVVIIFCVAATLSALSIIQENEDIRKAQEPATYPILIHAYSDLEGAILAYAAEKNPAPDSKDRLNESVAYLDHVFGNILQSENLRTWTERYDFQVFHEKTRASLVPMQNYIRDIDKVSHDEARYELLVRLRNLHDVFSFSGLEDARRSGEGEYAGEKHMWLFASVMIMGVSGLGLIALLLHKISTLEIAYEEKQKIAGLLEPRMAAVESSKDGIGITDPDGNIRYVNKALSQFHGFENPDELIGKNWHVLYSADQTEWMEAEVLPALRRQGHWQGHCTGLRKDKSQFYQDLTMTHLENGGWVWIVRDYSEIMDAMNTSNRRLAAIEAAGDGIGMVDREGCLTYINRALMNLHGITDELLGEYIGQPWENLYTPEGKEDIHQKVMPHIQQYGHWKGEAAIRRTDDKVVMAEMSLTLLPDGGLIGTARDITDRKKSEKEKEQLQKQFFQAQKMEAIGRLAGGIAHDFNNILASMLGYAEFLIDDLDPASKQHHFARQIMQGGRKAQHLVEQILAFSRRKETNRAAIDMGEAVNETAAMLRATLPPMIMLDVQITPQNVEINANATQISQILMNLCVNARDAMTDERGELKVTVDRMRGADFQYPSCISDAVPGINYTPETQFASSDSDATVLLVGTLSRNDEYICVSVADTGCGMDRQVMEHIFEPFFTTKELDKGTGLGLSTVHGLVAGHQGALVVRSTPGKGTRFELYFPAAARSLSPVENMTEEEGASSRMPVAAGKHILLVEDENTVREMLTHMLRRMGCEVNCCQAGDEAIDHLRENPEKYDLVLSDHMMPNMTGVELAQEIHVDFPDLPVVLISGYSPKKLEDAMAINPSIRAVLKKPVTGKKLRETVENILMKTRQAA